MTFVSVQRRGAVAVVGINRPQALNALNTALLDELKETFDALANETETRAVVLTGEGKAFVAGADIAQMKGFASGDAVAYAARGVSVFSSIENLPQPVIAAVNGYALGGGCELALSCDIRIASDRALFGQPEVGLGITPGFGGTQRLPRIVGMGAAMQIILTGQSIDAAEALRIGLVNAVFPHEVMLESAIGLAQAIAQNAPFAVRAAKRAMRSGADKALETGIADEAKLFSQCFDTQDQKKAMDAFVNKRKPGGPEGAAGRDGQRNP